MHSLNARIHTCIHRKYVLIIHRSITHTRILHIITYACIHPHKPSHMNTDASTYACTHIYTYTHACIHRYTHRPIFIHTCTHTYVLIVGEPADLTTGVYEVVQVISIVPRKKIGDIDIRAGLGCDLIRVCMNIGLCVYLCMHACV
jgi:hypothetical protein